MSLDIIDFKTYLKNMMIWQNNGQL